MSYCIPQLRLSNGKLVNIPVFSYHSNPVIESKMGGILKIYHEQNSQRTEVTAPTLLTDSELVELYSLLYNANISLQEGSGITTTEAYTSIFIYWYEKADGTYTLNGVGRSTGTQFLNKSNASVIFVAAPISDLYVKSSYMTYNDTGVTGNDYSYAQTPYETHTYIQMINYLEANNIYDRVCVNFTNDSGHLQIDAFYNGAAINLARAVGHGAGGSVIGFSYDTIYENITKYASDHHLDIGINVYDSDNPYSFIPATFGGGNGSMGLFDPDGVDPAEVPPLPQLSASDIGFMSVYNPSGSQLKALSAFLWSSAFDIDSFKKLFSDPMQCIIGLGVVPVTPTIGGSKNVTFGDIDSGISMSYISTEYVEKDMGSVSIDLLYGSFMDYKATTIQIYLPYIGFRQLSPDDLIGGSIGVIYHINVIDGGLTAYIRHSSRGVLYQYSGSCIANVPLSSINYSGALQNAISAALSGASVAVGAATGAAPITAVGAMGLVNSAANLAMNSKPTVQRSGTTSGSSGIMAIQRPYIIIQRANISVPDQMNNFVGNTTNVTMPLSACTGFTMVDQIHLDNVICTEGERDELLRLLKEGVIL